MWSGKQASIRRRIDFWTYFCSVYEWVKYNKDQSRIWHGRLVESRQWRFGPTHTGDTVERCATFRRQNHPLSTKSSKLYTLNFGNSVDCDKMADFQLCQPCQIRLWRQCVPALIQPWLCTKSVLTIKIVKQAVCISVCWCLITTAYISGLIASLLLTAGTVQPGRWTFLLNISPSLANNTWQHASENQVTSSSLVPLYACTVIPGSTTVLLQLEIKTFM